MLLPNEEVSIECENNLKFPAKNNTVNSYNNNNNSNDNDNDNDNNNNNNNSKNNITKVKKS